MEYWNGSTFQNGTCSTTNAIPQPQQWTVTITDGGVSTSASTVVYYNGPPTSNPGDCGRPAGNIPAGCHLVFLQAPTSGIAKNGDLSPVPVVEIEDAANQPVTGDVSAIVLSKNSFAGSGSGSLSNTCSGSESGGYVPFGAAALAKRATTS